MKEVRLAKAMVKTLVKDEMHYRGRLIADSFALVARCGVLLLLYAYVFRLNHGAIRGTTFTIVAWSIFLYFVLSAMRLRDISRLIMRDVQSGNIEILLNKPVSYLWYRAWWQIGSGIYSLVIALFFGAIALFLTVGLPATMFAGLFLPTLILTFLGSVILTLLLYILIGFLAFWMEDVNPVFWIVDKFVMMLGGSYLPVALFPPLMLKLANWSPFGAAVFITHTVNATWVSEWSKLLLIQLGWIITFSLLVYFIYNQARLKISVNGG